LRSKNPGNRVDEKQQDDAPSLYQNTNSDNGHLACSFVYKLIEPKGNEENGDKAATSPPDIAKEL
jgi:hypothetical protein